LVFAHDYGLPAMTVMAMMGSNDDDDDDDDDE
jgi:hypothetical protein